VLDENGNPNGREAWVYEFGRNPAKAGGEKVEGGKWTRR
jgi:hypothetical protein